MTYQITLTPEAQRDLRKVYRYIAMSYSRYRMQQVSLTG